MECLHGDIRPCSIDERACCVDISIGVLQSSGFFRMILQLFSNIVQSEVKWLGQKWLSEFEQGALMIYTVLQTNLIIRIAIVILGSKFT